MRAGGVVSENYFFLCSRRREGERKKLLYERLYSILSVAPTTLSFVAGGERAARVRAREREREKGKL